MRPHPLPPHWYTTLSDQPLLSSPPAVDYALLLYGYSSWTDWLNDEGNMMVWNDGNFLHNKIAGISQKAWFFRNTGMRTTNLVFWETSAIMKKKKKKL